MTVPGIVLSQPDSATTPSNRWPRTTSSIESAITSRLMSDAFMPAVPIETPSETAMVLNSIGVPPAARTPRFTCPASRRRCTLHGITSIQVLAIAMSGRRRSASRRPSAFSMARLGARSGPSSRTRLSRRRSWVMRGLYQNGAQRLYSLMERGVVKDRLRPVKSQGMFQLDPGFAAGIPINHRDRLRSRQSEDVDHGQHQRLLRLPLEPLVEKGVVIDMKGFQPLEERWISRGEGVHHVPVEVKPHMPLRRAARRRFLEEALGRLAEELDRLMLERRVEHKLPGRPLKAAARFDQPAFADHHELLPALNRQEHRGPLFEGDLTCWIRWHFHHFAGHWSCRLRDPAVPPRAGAAGASPPASPVASAYLAPTRRKKSSTVGSRRNGFCWFSCPTVEVGASA